MSDETPLFDGGIAPAWATEWGRDRRGAFVSFRVGAVTHRLRWIPPGRFWMGSPEGEEGRWEGEGPRHEVELTRGYWLGETSVTQALWEAVTGQTPSYFKGAERPVEHVSWHDCITFLDQLNERVRGLDARLPTEAEWERACRGGTDGPTWLGANDEGNLDSIAWYGANSGGETHDVRGKAANPYGLYDMLGNVLEWCSDLYGPYETALVRDPVGAANGSFRVRRGGGWRWTAGGARASGRDGYDPSSRGRALGFRLARDNSLLSAPSADSRIGEEREAGSGPRPRR
ncbi:MAG: formylglycine-generating enzyme family protein [Polyangiales bacterium]